ncbi:MAG: fatty acid desaturase [Caldilineaceae bacterium]
MNESKGDSAESRLIWKEWAHILFPESEPDKRRALFSTNAFVIGHALLTVVSLALGLWLLPVLITLAPFYGGWLLYLCNNTQHVGLRDNVPDFRLYARTILLNPFVRFLYWHANFHIEHHAPPCPAIGWAHSTAPSSTICLR